MKAKRNFRDFLQGIASFAILYFVIYGDPSRLPAEWFRAIPHNLFNSGHAFLAWMTLLYFIEGTKLAESEAKDGSAAFKRALDYYIQYWKICVPLVLVGYLFFSVHRESPLYCPMFVDLGFLNVSRAIVALTNNIHEGTWLISSIALCAFCASLYARLRQEKGVVVASLALAAGFVAQCGLYLVILPFMYHRAVFRIAPIIGSVAFALGFLLNRQPAIANSAAVRSLASMAKGDRFALLSRPLRYVGCNWVAFWMAQFYMTCYYYSVAATVHMTFGATVFAYVIFALLTAGVLALIEYGRVWLIRLWRQSRWMLPVLALMLAVPFLLRQVLELSMGSYAQFKTAARLQWPVYVMACALAISCLIMALRALTGRWLPSALILTVLLTLLSIANYYTMKYHGALLTVEDVNNIQTAAGVIHSYDLSVDRVAGRILLTEAAAAACAVLAWWIARRHREKIDGRKRWLRRGAWLLVGAFGLYITYFAAAPIVEREDNIWSWGSLYAKIGFFSGTVESTLANLEFSVYEPEGYSEERVAQLKEDALKMRAETESVAAQEQAGYPDIVMILNETYYNLDMYIDTHADVDYMENYNALDNAIKGYAEVPLTGGGTNGTEYEMLTANSMSLVNAYAPFNRLNFTDTVSLPGYLKQLGYATIGAHPHESQNYHRGTSWAQMGIDRNYFIRDFKDLEFYANRKNDHRATDTSVLKNLIRFMEDMPEDQPRFAFLATMQNHGGWEMNTPEQAVVHSHPDTDDEALVAKIDEYLSCITYTDDMIAYMRNYYTRLYEETGRRVIVCMVGDHSPSFIPSLEGLCKWEDRAVAERRGKMTPYFIWANYPLELADADLEGTEDMDLCCLMPTMLKVAGVPMSYYYRYVCDMKRDVAVFTNVASDAEDQSGRIGFYSRDGMLRHIDEDSPLAGRVRDYMIMEYNLSARKSAMEPALFQPAVSVDAVE